jgi:two-component system LytT family response regulator
MNGPQPLREIRVLVVDDEAPARQRLHDLLSRDAQVGGIEECANGSVAVEMIKNDRPDLVFLDVRMPGLSGFDVVETIGADNMPLTIFVTAYDKHAIRAFEANALDYLLKPFSDERFETALARVKARLEDQNLRAFGRQLLELASKSSLPDERWDRLVVKSGGTTRFVRIADIDWIEAAGMYVNLHVGGKELLYRAGLQEIADKLDPQRFVRVHRSAIVNIDSIVQLEPISHGEFEVVLKNGSRSRVSRNYRMELERLLGQSL